MGAVGVGRNGAARVALCWQELDDAQEAQCSRVESPLDGKPEAEIRADLWQWILRKNLNSKC